MAPGEGESDLSVSFLRRPTLLAHVIDGAKPLSEDERAAMGAKAL